MRTCRTKRAKACEMRARTTRACALVDVRTVRTVVRGV